RRYASALELADDLARFLAYEPILARPVGPLGRLGRWCRRQPALAGLSAALVAVVLAALVGLTGLWLVGRHDRAVAEQSLRDARCAVHRHFTLLSEVELGNDPGARPLRKRLLEDALAYFQGLRAQRGHDPGLRADVADAFFRVARITSEIG